MIESQGIFQGTWILPPDDPFQYSSRPPIVHYLTFARLRARQDCVDVFPGRLGSVQTEMKPEDLDPRGRTSDLALRL
jgi:hypothetical protein